MKMKGEIDNFIMVWTTVILSLCYSHSIVKFFPQGCSRFFAILPIVCLFLSLPLNLTTIHLGGTTSFFVAWLASFKLLLFAFGKGPLSSSSSSNLKDPIPLSKFIPLACFPIKFQQQDSSDKDLIPTSKVCRHQSPLSYATKALLLATLIRVYSYKDYFHPKIIWFFYCLHIYFALEIILAMFGTAARILVRVELEPQFDEPYLATSLQDFWGKRWNLMVSNILRPTVYHPVRLISGRAMPIKWASLPAILATFLVSGLMHELVFYNIGRLRPSGEVTCFFVLHGVALAVEITVKKLAKRKIRIPGFLSRPLALAFVILTSFWLFFPPFLRGKADVKGCTEFLAFIEFMKDGRLVSPCNMTCPFL